jgi:hypothetical protein
MHKARTGIVSDVITLKKRNWKIETALVLRGSAIASHLCMRAPLTLRSSRSEPRRVKRMITNYTVRIRITQALICLYSSCFQYFVSKLICYYKFLSRYCPISCWCCCDFIKSIVDP